MNEINLVNEPYIHTILGNVPVSSLEHYIQWRETEEMVMFTEIYKAPDGTVVRQDSHSYIKKGPLAPLAAGPDATPEELTPEELTEIEP